MPNLKVFTALALCALTLGVRAEDTPLLIELPAGVLPGDISSNGMVVGALRSGGGFYWLPTTGVVYIGGQAATAVSKRGDAIAGTALDTRGVEQAAIWQRAAEWRLLGSVVPNAVPCDTLLSSTYGASENGAVIVGLAWNGCQFARAFRWEESTGMVDLGALAGESTRANGVSGDGRVVVGWQVGRTTAGHAMGGWQAGAVHGAFGHHRRGPRRQPRRLDRGRAGLRVRHESQSLCQSAGLGLVGA